MIVRKGESVFISDEWLNKIKIFTNESHKDHLSFNRSVQDKKDDIFLGKVGEIALFLIFGSHGYDVLKPNLTNMPYGDGGKDNIICKRLADAKTTILKENHHRLTNITNKKRELKSDVYLGFQYDPATQIATYLGGISRERLIKENLIRQADEGDGVYYYVDICHLVEFDENLNEIITSYIDF